MAVSAVASTGGESMITVPYSSAVVFQHPTQGTCQEQVLGGAFRYLPGRDEVDVGHYVAMDDLFELEFPGQQVAESAPLTHPKGLCELALAQVTVHQKHARTGSPHHGCQIQADERLANRVRRTGDDHHVGT